MSRVVRYFRILSILWVVALSATYPEEIEDYHTAITVHDSGSLHVKEDILYDFGDARRHGIYRDIPLYIKTDKYAKAVPAGIHNISTEIDNTPVKHKQHTLGSKSGGELLRLQIGDPNKLIGGKHAYTIEYDVNRGVYPSTLPGMEAIRWNAVGSGSNVPTNHASADVFLPAQIHRENARVNGYVGTYGSKNSNVDYKWVSDRQVRFDAAGLSPHEALTIEVNYPKGLLDQGADHIRSTWFERLIGSWHWGAIIAFILFLRNYAKKFGVDDHAGSITPQYYPPKDLSLLQSGLIIDKFADKEDFSAAILELGTMGYLEIDDQDAVLPVIKKTDKETDTKTLTEDQRYILDSILFNGKKQYVVSKGDPVVAERLNEKLAHLNDMLYRWSVTSGQMRTDPQRSRSRFLMTAGIAALVLSIAAIASVINLFGVNAAIMISMGTIFVGVGLLVLLSSIRQKAYGGIFFGAIWLAATSYVFTGMLSQLQDIPALLTSPVILIPIVGTALWYFYRKVGVFTQKGLDTYRYLLGYKDFITRVEKDKIKRFLKDDPLYLDKSLPYAVLFGASKHWLKLYDKLNTPQPVWYYGDIHHIDNFNHAVGIQSIAPASESGGFSGGGGFAGGGGGGGGVGSW